MKRSDMQVIVTQAQEEMKKAGLDPWNLSLLSKFTGVSRPTLRKCRDEGFLHKHLNKGRRKPSRLLSPYEGKINDCLSKGVTNSDVIYSELLKLGYQGKLTTLKVHIAKNRHLCPHMVRTVKVAKGNRGRRYKLDAGDCFQLDWGFVNAIDSYGVLHKYACLVMVCGHCGKRFIEFFTNARQENLFIGMIHGFIYLGGIPKRIMTDNMKSVYNSRTGNVITWNKKYQDFMFLLGFSTTLCKPYHAWTKGRAERLVRYMKENFVPGRSFTNIADLNDQAIAWCKEKNALVHRGLHCIPNDIHSTEVFAAIPEEKVLFLYLAPERVVAFDGSVEYEGFRYGVPLTYNRKTVRVQRQGSSVMLLSYGGEVLSSFSVDWKTREYYCTHQWDYPQEDQPEEMPTQPVGPVVMRFQNGRSETRPINLSIYDRVSTKREDGNV